jgi:hypothetical protein
MDELFGLDDLIEDDEPELEILAPPRQDAAPSQAAPPQHHASAPLPTPGDRRPAAAHAREEAPRGAAPPSRPAGDGGWAFQPVSRTAPPATRPQNASERAAAAAAAAARPDMTVEKFSGMRIRCGAQACAASRTLTCLRLFAPLTSRHRAARAAPPRARARSNRVVSSVVVDERLSAMRVLRLPSVRCVAVALLARSRRPNRARQTQLAVRALSAAPRASCDMEGAWATVGALAEKAGTKEGSNGKKYGIWCAHCARAAALLPHTRAPCSRACCPRRTLTDLDGANVKLFLFGEAFAEHWKARRARVGARALVRGQSR